MKRLAIPLAALALATPVLADGHMAPLATAAVEGDGISGTVTLMTTASGTVHAVIDVTGVPEGVHGIHLHETGDCSAADFTSAGGHIAGDRQHGLVEGGPHPGDMPNATVGADGALKVEAFLPHLDGETMILDADGAAFIIHEGADDYASQPAGDAGSRIACGVFEAG